MERGESSRTRVVANPSEEKMFKMWEEFDPALVHVEPQVRPPVGPPQTNDCWHDDLVFKEDIRDVCHVCGLVKTRIEKKVHYLL